MSKNYWGGGAFSFSYLTSLLEFSLLTEEDKIDVLSKVVYESSPKALKKDTKDFSLPSVPESFSVEELLNEYQLLLTKGNFLAQKYYFLLEGKNESQINYMKTVVSCLKEEKDLKNSFQYKDENMAVLLLEFFDIKELLSDFVSKIEDPKNVSEETRDMVTLYIDSLKECIQNILQLEPAFEKSQKSSQPVDTLLFLLDENNQPLFQLNKFSLEERNRIANLIRGLLSGKKDFERGIKHSKLLTRQDLDIDVFLNKNGDMVVSYILLSDNSFLLLTFDRKKNIYDVSESIVRKYKSKISSLNSSNLGMLLDTQKEFKENLYKDLGIERELKL